MKTMDENKTAQPTTEQLLKLLESEMNASRQRRLKLDSKRRTMQIVSIMFIVVGAAVAFWVLTFMLDDIRPAQSRGGPDSAQQESFMEVR